MIRHLLLATLASLQLLSASPEPLAGRYGFRSYGPDQGLKNQAVTSLAQDADGFIFAGTEDGLYRYDGSRFVRLGTAQGLPSDAIVQLHAGADGTLWVATGAGIVAWKGLGPDRTRTPGPLLPGEEVFSLSTSRNGRMAVSTARGIFEGTSAGLAPVGGPVHRDAGAAWLAPEGGELLVAQRGQLHHRDGAGRWQTQELPGKAKGETFQCLIRDREGRFWIRGRNLLLRAGAVPGPVEDLSGALPGASVQKGILASDGQGRVWAPTNLGLVCFEKDRTWVLGADRGLPNQWVTTALVDREGSLWTASEGVQRLQGRLAWTGFTRSHGIPSDTVWGVFRDAAGTLWLGTNRGLARAEGRGFKAVPEAGPRAFYTFVNGPGGALWIGGTSGSSSANALLVHRGNAFQSVPLASIKGPSTVNSLAWGPEGALYVATQAQGIHRVVAGRCEAVALPGGGPAESVNQLIQGASGRLWAASMEGLLTFDGRAWRRFGKQDGLLEGQIEAVAQAPEGSVWVSYWNIHGLSRVAPDGDRLRVVEHLQGPAALVEDNIYSLGMDARGALWLGTAMGMKRWKDGQLEQFGRGEGLPGDDAAANAFLAEPDGDVWFGMANGLARMEAAQDPGRGLPPPTRLTTVLDGAGRPLEGPLPRVAWAQRALTFRYSALSFLDEAKIQRQVRLVGFEDTWRDTEVAQARYTGLPPGRYRFEARCRFGAGPFGEAAAQEFIIVPPWWRTPWALGLGLLSFSGLILLAFRARVAVLRKRNLALEALVAERTRDLSSANKALNEASMVDPLTGLKNRRYLGLSMPDELALLRRRRRGPNSHQPDLLLIMVDLDHFKLVNDTYGHAAGDAVLKQASDVLRLSCRESDIVVRWGGEEFLIVARHTDRDSAEVLVRAMHANIRNHAFDLGNGTTLRKTASFGFTAFPVLPTELETQRWEDAVELADRCLYAAKHTARDGWVGVLVEPPCTEDVKGILAHMPELLASGGLKVFSSFEGEITWT